MESNESPSIRICVEAWETEKPSKFLPVWFSFHAIQRGPEMLLHGRQMNPPVKDGALCLASVYLLFLCLVLFPNLRKTPQRKQEQRRLDGGRLCATDAAKGKNSGEGKSRENAPLTWRQHVGMMCRGIKVALWKAIINVHNNRTSFRAGPVDPKW